MQQYCNHATVYQRPYFHPPPRRRIPPFFDVSIQHVLDCLNAPEHNEGLATDHYTAEKALNNRRLHVYYYLTYPLQATDTGAYAIVDFIGCTKAEDRPAKTNPLIP